MIKEIISKLNSELPATVRLVAVSKFHPFEAIEEAYAAGQRVFAESRPQELLAKVRRLEEVRAAKIADAGTSSCEDSTCLRDGSVDSAEAYMSDVEWHFIGHLQTNKLKMVLPYVSLVQSVDSVRLLDAIQAWGAANQRVISVLLEPHVAAEESKQGFEAEEIYDILSRSAKTSTEEASNDSGAYPNIRFRGIMGMATFTDDQSVIASDFAALRAIFDTCRSRFPHLAADFTELSIGMSDDYPLAIEYGSTMIRVGSMIFGERNY